MTIADWGHFAFLIVILGVIGICAYITSKNRREQARVEQARFLRNIGDIIGRLEKTMIDGFNEVTKEIREVKDSIKLARDSIIDEVKNAKAIKKDESETSRKRKDRQKSG